MTNFTTRMIIAAATMVAAAGVASAQTMKAEIPFPFRVGDRVMAAGTYKVRMLNSQSGAKMFRVANPDSGRALAAASHSARDAPREWVKAGDPVLRFDCVEARCALAGIWAGEGMPEHVIAHPKPGDDAPIRMATVVMRPDRGD